ncbi:protein eiger-like [Pollicipes pollicipes]|uniref:protein eiger-like n=1 Tax=Pollicipes pollicipes TaxID=41117 RepID=UPI0018854B00|nr:protein eiger-like [Pollicipes pollicipes]
MEKEEQRADRPRGWAGPGAGMAGVLSLTSMVLCLGLALLEVNHMQQSAVLRSQVLTLQRRLERVEAGLASGESVSPQFRQRRSVNGPAPQTNAAGIPIVDRPYGHRPGHQPRTDGLQVYDSFSSGKAGSDGTILPHHRSSAAFRTGKLGRVNAAEAAPQASTDPRTTDRPRAAQAGVHHRRSRVRQARRRSRPRAVARRRAGAARPKGRSTAEARRAPIGFAAPSSGSGGHKSRSGHGRSKRLMRMMEQMRDSLSVTAAHFEGHTANYTLSHPHYAGNGVLRNSQPDGMFADWRHAAWMSRHGFSDDFQLYGGQVTVRRPGVYYIYAQINYFDVSDLNGFEIRVDSRPIVTCLTMEGSDNKQKANTCHTSAATYLNSGDSVTIHDLQRLRISQFLPDRSFFGLVRLAGTAR